MTTITKAELVLENGNCVTGEHFGGQRSMSGEVVFNTGMVGYPEAMTDPSYRGQILVLTYPLIGNYGVPGRCHGPDPVGSLESERVQITGLIVSEASWHVSHWSAAHSLDQWLYQAGVPALAGIDTRAL